MTIHLRLTVLWSLHNVLVTAASTSLQTVSRHTKSTGNVN